MMTKFAWLTISALMFATSSAFAAPSAAPGGLYVGYYQEDPRTNPEDPMPGAFVLRLPENDAAFDGAMFFTFVGCQKSNVGKVSGVKAGTALSGTWSGKIDDSMQSGPYKGSYDAGTSSYKGTYSNSGGKQFKDIAGCIQYYIGPNGTWEMFAVEQNQPASFKIDISGATVSWSAVPSAVMTLMYVIDPAIAQSGSGNPIVFQTVMPAQTTKFNLAPARLVKGKQYIGVAMFNNAQAKRVAFASKKFVAP